MFSQTNPPRKIGINLLCVPSNMAGTGYYALNLILHIVRIEKNNQYTLFLNKDLVKHFNSIEGNIKLIPFKITNVYKRIFIEQVYLPFLTKSLDILHSIGNSVPIFSTCKNIVTIQLTNSYTIYIIL